MERACGIKVDGRLPDWFVYTDKRSRSVHVVWEAILKALGKVYKAEKLRRETDC